VTKPQILFVAKLIVGIGLLALLMSQVATLQETLDVLGRLNMFGIVVVLLVPIPLIWMSCLKWHLLLSYRDVHVRIGMLMKFYTVGYFFNNFLPSSVGGDAARSYFVGKRIKSQTESLAAVVLERLTGLVTLIALAVIGFMATPVIHGDLLVTGPLTILTVGCLVAMGVLWAPAPFAARLGAWADRLPLLGKIIAKLIQMRAALQGFWSAPRIVGLTCLYSFGYHGLTVLNVWVVATVLGLELDFLSLCAVTPIILVIAAVPTTPGSIGVWEWAYSVLLLPVGADLEQGLAIALVLRAQLLVFSVLGGILYLFERNTSKSGTLENVE